MLSFSRTRLNHRDDRAFAVAGPTLWNNLPVDIQTAPFYILLNLCLNLF